MNSVLTKNTNNYFYIEVYDGEIFMGYLPYHIKESSDCKKLVDGLNFLFFKDNIHHVLKEYNGNLKLELYK